MPSVSELIGYRNADYGSKITTLVANIIALLTFIITKVQYNMRHGRFATSKYKPSVVIQLAFANN